MKLAGNRPRISALLRLTSTLIASLIISTSLLPTQASAITRTQVIARANSWVKRHVIYSQSSYYAGYRRDCSGFVSMAWRLRTSYTSATIAEVAHRISIAKLLPGDAVRRPGHVEIFDGWKNRRARTYFALEESTWGVPAIRRVKTIFSYSMALRYRHITVPPRTPVKPPVSTVPTPGIPPTGTVPATSTVVPTTIVYPIGLSSTQVSTLSEPSWMTGYFGGGNLSSLWSYE